MTYEPDKPKREVQRLDKKTNDQRTLLSIIKLFGRAVFNFHSCCKFSVLLIFFFSVLVVSLWSLDYLMGDEKNVRGNYTQEKEKNVAHMEPPDQVEKNSRTIIHDSNDIGAFKKNESPPNSQFVDNADGTVTDNQTGLIWLKNANCFGLKSWTEALSTVANLANDTCGLTDGSVKNNWRLPNFSELYDLFHLIRVNFAPHVSMDAAKLSDSDIFTGMQPGGYWSSTIREKNTSQVWCVYLNGMEGFSGKATAYYVWPVKSHTKTQDKLTRFSKPR